MSFWLDRFRDDEDEIWKELRYMLTHPSSKSEQNIKNKQELQHINSVLDKVFEDKNQTPKPKKEPYLKYEDLLNSSKNVLSNFEQDFKQKSNLNQVNKTEPETTSKKTSESFGDLNNNTKNNNLSWQEKAFDFYLKNAELIKNSYPVASNMYTDARTDFSRAKEDKNATVLENMNSLDSKTIESLKNYGVKSNERGVYYNTDSDTSKKFGKSKEIKKAFDKNIGDIKKGKFKGTDLNFEASYLDAIKDKDKFDRHNSLQHAKLIDAYFDEQGSPRGRVIDNVDYIKRSDDTLKDKIKNYPNNHGYSLQEKGALENYFTVMDVIINEEDDKEKEKILNRLLRKFRH